MYNLLIIIKKILLIWVFDSLNIDYYYEFDGASDALLSFDFPAELNHHLPIFNHIK